MNNIIMRKLVLTADYRPISTERIVGSFTISSPPGNAGEVIFRGDENDEVPWIPGEWHDFSRINLADVQIKGTPGDIVTVIGGTW